MVDGVYRLRARGLKALLERVRGAVMHRAQGERTPGPLGPDTLANTMVPCHVPDLEALCNGARWTRAWVTQARVQLAGSARLSKVVCDKGFWAGTDLWWLAQQGILFVVPAKEHMAVAADARALAAAGEGGTVGCRVHTVRQGQGHAAWSEWLETEGVGIPGLTTDAP